MLLYFLTVLLLGLKVESPMIPTNGIVSETADVKSWGISFSVETEKLEDRRMLYRECRADCRQLIRPQDSFTYAGVKERLQECATGCIGLLR